MKPLFGGFFRIAPLAQTIDDGGFWGWWPMGEDVFGDGGRWADGVFGDVGRWVSAFLGMTADGRGNRRRAVV